MAAAQYASLQLLLRQNRAGLLRTADKNGGYKDLESGRGKLCGVMRFLSEKTRAFARISKKAYRANKSKKAKTMGRKEKSSTKKHGDAFHRNVYHSLFCLERKECRCEALFGKATKRAPAKSSICYKLVKAALEFLQAHKLVPVASEQVIVSREAPVGTRFDCLCHDPATKETVLVSWKTGYKQLVAPKLANCMSMMTKARTSDEMSLREHIAQLTCELHMLQDTHKVPVQRAYIVYISTLGTYRVTALEPKWIAKDYRQGWTWLLDKFQKHQELKRKRDEKKAAAAAPSTRAPKKSRKS
jgi:hypothetical protein